MGMRKLRVLPVPVEAVARMSSPSRAGGMAPAWTGVGVMKPAAVRRALRESEIWKSVKVMEAASSMVADDVTSDLERFRVQDGIKSEGRQGFPFRLGERERGNAVTHTAGKRTCGVRELRGFLFQHCLVYSFGKHCCCTARLDPVIGLLARATNASETAGGWVGYVALAVSGQTRIHWESSARGALREYFNA